MATPQIKVRPEYVNLPQISQLFLLSGGLGRDLSALLGTRRPVQVLEELGRLHFQSRHDPHDVREREITLTPLNAPHVASVNTDVVGKCLLRIAPGFAFGTHPGTKNLQRILCGRSRLRSHAAIFGVRGLKHYSQ